MSMNLLAESINRRSLLRRAGTTGAAVVAAGAVEFAAPRHSDGALVATYGTGTSKFIVNDFDILNFALNSEYLAAEFYSRAAFGQGLASNLTTGVGTVGTVTGGRQVPFATQYLQSYAQEIAADEIAHVQFLRNSLGSRAVARPSFNLSTAFAAAAVAAGIPNGSSFDPYADENSFLTAGYLLNDVDVTAYVGAAPYVQDPLYVAAAAGLLGVEGYHAGQFRVILYERGQTAPQLLENADLISVVRNKLSAAYDGRPVTDEGINRPGGVANIVPSDGNALAFGRPFGSILNIVYQSMTSTPTPGGFCPSGFNGRVR